MSRYGPGMPDTGTYRTMTTPMAFHEIVDAAKLISGGGERVTWAVGGDVTSLLTGTLRYIESTNQATGERATSGDVRDQFLRITATFEYWLPVAEVLTLMSEGLFMFEDSTR